MAVDTGIKVAPVLKSLAVILRLLVLAGLWLLSQTGFASPLAGVSHFVVTGSGGIFPTIFGVLREQQPDAVMGVFHDWNDYGRLFERKAVNVIKDTDGPTNAIREAAAFWKDNKATFTFIHLDHVDHAGHEF